MTEYVPYCELCGRELHGDVSAYLCLGCARVTTERLLALPTLYSELEQHLPPGRRPGIRSSGKASAPASLVNEDVLELRGAAGYVLDLESWHAAMNADLGWSTPVPAGSVADRIRKAAAALHVNMLWIAESWPAAGAFAEEVRDLHRAITSYTDPRARGTRMGNCPTAVDGVLCRAVLRLDAGESVATCRWCGATYPPATWAALRLAQDELEEVS